MSVVRPQPDFFSQQIVNARRFYLNLRPAPTSAIAVICGGWELCAPDYSIGRTQFPYLGLEYVCAGRGELQLAGRRYPLQAGSVFVYGGNVPHSFVTHPRERLSKCFIDFTGRKAKALLTECGLTPGTHLNISSRDEVRSAFEELLRMGTHARDAERLTALQLEILLLTIAGAGEASAAGSERSFHTFTRCRTYLEENFLVVKNIEQCARACRVDPAYLSRLFSRFAKQTPYAFLQRLKMGRAAALLEDGTHLVREVADLLDLDPFQFSRTFKRVHGMAPTSFLRERMKSRRPAAE